VGVEGEREGEDDFEVMKLGFKMSTKLISCSRCIFAKFVYVPLRYCLPPDSYPFLRVSSGEKIPKFIKSESLNFR